MSTSDVTRHGVRGEHPGRQAVPAALRGGRRRRGERGMVPEAEFTSYYGRPVIKAPSWEARDIAGYFFLGGLAGAGSVLAAGARLTGRPRTARRMTLSSLAAISLSTAALVHDLGRPARFANMLRVVKPTSPMSMGSWLLAGYGPATGAAAWCAVTGRLPRAGAAATTVTVLLGPAVTTYTAVLAADTAVPAWHGAHRELPYLFAASATAAAAGMALVLSPARENAPARRAAVLGAAAETAATKLMEHRLGPVAETCRTGTAGRLLRAADALTVAGGVLTALAGRHRAAAVMAGAALLAGSACTRFGVFHAGLGSAEDPRYTVAPQRERLAQRAAPSSSPSS
ncbi:MULTISPECIES: NrfD/PsrC family molybdoenzyme membrane anchor subunit [Streptomycetaceae]|uniref:Polysulfide reductase, NrfD n=1 Tax=Streptantibioticus cattleyicolor (strain ATCC 35852 / DSM 46488 / JCM 4925 / NBRC 14057 / NRRL 8057) TaxID=1003195 RepID=G8WVR8_STREN|nr:MULTISPECIES: NrfD/PsrC family molybdoenzyme membrane anchor subunit [Streptomycetaceae]AEW97825.1 polysulfide reductase, NrfD [Streptantibioticus cattleyicolor NRRL 8057 = DSM 46488]MYS62240.1 polysulfide reductase [Streptomyces sp. SID5468]